MTAPTARTELAAELWVSFAAVLRSYAVVASLNGGEVPRVDVFENSVTITAGCTQFSMLCDRTNGAGSWRITDGEREEMMGRFEMLPEGRMLLDGRALDLDHAAIDLVACVMESAGRES